LHHATRKEIIDTLDLALLGCMMQAINQAVSSLTFPWECLLTYYNCSAFKIVFSLIERAEVFAHFKQSP
jgi:hypothetical protein